MGLQYELIEQELVPYKQRIEQLEQLESEKKEEIENLKEQVYKFHKILNELKELKLKLFEIGGTTDFERNMIIWINAIFKDYDVKDFMELMENKVVWMKMADIAKFKTVAFESQFYSQKNIENYVKMLGEIWDEQKQIQIFSYYNEVLQQDLNENFQFENDFEDIMYSHTDHVVLVIFSVTFLTMMTIKEMDNDYQVNFTDFVEIDSEAQELIDQVVKITQQIYNFIGKDVEKRFEEENVGFNSLPNQNINRKKINTLADIEVLKKVEKQQKLIDDLEKENIDIKEKLKITTQERDYFQDKNKQLEIQIEEIHNYRQDLIKKLKQKELTLQNEEVREKTEEIENLQMQNRQLQQQIEVFKQEEDNKREEISKLNLQLNNFKTQYEKLQQKQDNYIDQSQGQNNSQLQNDYDELQNKYQQLQDETFTNKEKFINMDFDMGKLKMEIQNLKMQNQELEFKLKNYDDNNFNNSEIYEDDFETIKKELSIEDDIKQLEEFNQDDNNDLQNKYKDMFQKYQEKCLSRIKILIKENFDKNQSNEQYLKENENLRIEMEEIHERNEDLENRIVENLIENNTQLQQLFSKANENSSQVAQDLLKAVMKSEHEIERQRINRRKQRREEMEKMAEQMEQLQTIYTLISCYFESNQI